MDLSELRLEIDDLDRQLLSLLEERMDVAEKIATYKIQHGLPVLDESRESEKLEGIKAQCRPETADLIGELFAQIMAASRAHQTSIMEKENGR